jgi:hypothetical protein
MLVLSFFSRSTCGVMDEGKELASHFLTLHVCKGGERTCGDCTHSQNIYGCGCGCVGRYMGSIGELL